jgi:hypothetical protein
MCESVRTFTRITGPSGRILKRDSCASMYPHARPAARPPAHTHARTYYNKCTHVWHSPHTVFFTSRANIHMKIQRSSLNLTASPSHSERAKSTNIPAQRVMERGGSSRTRRSRSVHKCSPFSNRTRHSSVTSGREMPATHTTPPLVQRHIHGQVVGPKLASHTDASCADASRTGNRWWAFTADSETYDCDMTLGIRRRSGRTSSKVNI